MALTATSNSKSTAPSFNLPAELQNSRLAVGLTRKELARQLGCKPSDIRLIEAGKGRAEIMIRAMNHLRVDLTGIAAGTLLHDRLRATRERRTWSIDKLAEKTGLTSMAITRLERGMGEVSDLLLVLRTLAPNFNRRGGSGGNGGDKDSRFTDEATVNALKLAFGEITFDPCAHSKSPVKPKGGCYFELGQDGLAEPWVGEFVFMNPPFTKLAAWTTCALLQWRAGQIAILACLIPTRTDSLFFKEALLAGASAFFFGDRLKFVKPDGTVEASKITTMLVVFGSTACQRATFAAHQKGVWVATSEGENGKPAQRGAESCAVSANMRHTAKIRTSCPNSSATPQVQNEARPISAAPASPELQELEAYFRDPCGLRKRAEYYGRRCQTDMDDLSSMAILRALRRPLWDAGIPARMEGILSSIASTINMSRARAKRRGVHLASSDDGKIVDQAFPSVEDPAEILEREARREGSMKALALICKDDAGMHALVDGVGKGLRGKQLCAAIGISEIELAAMRRRLKRTAKVVCDQLCLVNTINDELLGKFAA